MAIQLFRRNGLVAFAAGLVAAGLIAAAPHASAAEKKAEDKKGDEKMSIEDVMKKFHKGKEKSVFAQILAGKATDEQKKDFVAGYEAILDQKPPKGDEADWKKKVGAVVEAGKAVEKKADDKSIAALKAAANCKACHDLHKE